MLRSRKLTKPSYIFGLSEILKSLSCRDCGRRERERERVGRAFGAPLGTCPPWGPSSIRTSAR